MKKIVAEICKPKVGVKFFFFMCSTLLVSMANGQVFLKQELKQNALYVLERHGNDTTVVDSITTLNAFSEYSYHLEGSTIYLLWSAMANDGKVFYMNTYSLSENNEIELNEQYWIEEKENQKLFERGLHIKFTEEGISFEIDKGQIAGFTIRYKELNLKKDVPKILKAISQS